jgi:hypothetical protein
MEVRGVLVVRFLAVERDGAANGDRAVLVLASVQVASVSRLRSQIWYCN